jgi:serine/threonine-protein kinase RsbW
MPYPAASIRAFDGCICILSLRTMVQQFLWFASISRPAGNFSRMGSGALKLFPSSRHQRSGVNVIMVTKEYKFELKNYLSELKALHQHLSHWGGDIGLAADSIARINICLDELFTNIVSYGFDNDSEHIVKFTLIVDHHLVTINIEDDGIPFNPLEKVDPDFPENVESAKIGGLGILIIRKLMDNVAYERTSGKNKLTMRKNIPEKL